VTQQEIIQAVESQAAVSVTLETKLDSLNLDSLEFVELMTLCGVPQEKEVGIETVGDIVKAVLAA
jgi:acyl carrier protein